MTVRMPNAKLWTIGVDEVGLGSLAGPLVVCALVAPAHWCPQVPVGDSKKMTPPTARDQRCWTTRRSQYCLCVRHPFA